MKRQGMSVLELIVVFGLFSVISLVGYAAMRESANYYRRTSSRSSAQRELRRAEVALGRDLQAAGVSNVKRSNGPSSLGPPDGDALWMLSAASLVNGTMVRNQDGSPMWQAHILYYLAVPNGHSECTGGAGADGRDDHCPHKVLIRKVIDTGTAANPADPNSQETVAPDLNAYLTRPNGTDVSSMLTGAVKDVRIMGVNLLTFSTAINGGKVDVTLRATALEEARKSLAVGSVSLSTVAPTLTHEMSVFPSNP